MISWLQGINEEVMSEREENYINVHKYMGILIINDISKLGFTGKEKVIKHSVDLEV